MDIIIAFVIFLIVLSLPVLGVSVVVLFLLCVYRTLKLVDPEHRQISPYLVWFCLIPGVGNIVAIRIACGVASTLRKQFMNLGDHQPGDSYGLTGGLIWTSSLAALEVLSLVGYLVGFSSLNSWSVDVVFIMFNILFASTGVAWGNYWLRINEYRTRLETHSASGRINNLTQEESDYGEETGEKNLQTTAVREQKNEIVDGSPPS